MKKIIIVTDSMAMPRQGTVYEKTWIYRLKKEFRDFDIIDKSSRGSSTSRLVNEGGGGRDLLETYSPDLVIIQLGINECAPRLFKKTGLEYYILSKILPERLRMEYISLVKKRRVRNPEITDTPPDEFRKNLVNFFLRAEAINVKIIIIYISEASGIFRMKSPFIQMNIDRYNRIIFEASSGFNNVTAIEPFSRKYNINNMVIDELHLNQKGHKKIFLRLKKIIPGLIGA